MKYHKQMIAHPVLETFTAHVPPGAASCTLLVILNSNASFDTAEKVRASLHHSLHDEDGVVIDQRLRDGAQEDAAAHYHVSAHFEKRRLGEVIEGFAADGFLEASLARDMISELGLTRARSPEPA